MEIKHKSAKTGIVGMSGTGKTIYLFSELVNRVGTRFFFDQEGQHESYLAPKGVKYRLLLTEDDFLDFENDDAPKKAEDGELVIFDPVKLYEGRSTDAFNFFCEWVFELSKREDWKPLPKLFGVDELQTLISTDDITFYLSCVLETGRRYMLDWVSIQQAFNLVHNRLRNQLTEIVAFRTIERQALKFLEDLGFEPEQVKALPDLSYIRRDLKLSTTVEGEITP